MLRNRRLWIVEAVSLLVIIVTWALPPSAFAQIKYKTLHSFTGNRGGRRPLAGLIFDKAGNLYGTTLDGGAGDGVVFQLTPNADGSWKESVLHDFVVSKADGENCLAGLTSDAAGNLYGTTSFGGLVGGGIVFRLTSHPDGSWTETILHSFCKTSDNCDDGLRPSAGLIFDTAGNLYGTTQGGGIYRAGTVFKLTPHADGTWTESVLHSFKNDGREGWGPDAGVVFDAAGNLYGTTFLGGAHQFGTVFQLTSNPDGSWKEKKIHDFRAHIGGGDGAQPYAGLIMDAAGNLYGTTQEGGNFGCYDNIGCGVVFELTPNSDGSWKERVLHRFTGGADGGAPDAGLIFDKVGNLYGTTVQGGRLSLCNGVGCGLVFKLTPNSKGGWSETVLSAFGNHPGSNPIAGLIMDAAGNLYGTTMGDNNTTFGSVFEITP